MEEPPVRHRAHLLRDDEQESLFSFRAIFSRIAKSRVLMAVCLGSLLTGAALGAVIGTALTGYRDSRIIRKLARDLADSQNDFKALSLARVEEDKRRMNQCAEEKSQIHDASERVKKILGDKDRPQWDRCSLADINLRNAEKAMGSFEGLSCEIDQETLNVLSKAANNFLRDCLLR